MQNLIWGFVLTAKNYHGNFFISCDVISLGQSNSSRWASVSERMSPLTSPSSVISGISDRN